MKQGKIDFFKTTANSNTNLPKNQEFKLVEQTAQKPKVPPQEKLFQINCACEVERNGYQDLEIKQTDKNKVLLVFKTKHVISEGQEKDTLKFVIKYLKSGDLALEFGMKDITAIYAQNAHKGMLSITLNMLPYQAKPAALPNKNLSRNITVAGTQSMDANTQSQYKVFLSNMLPELVQGLCKAFKDISQVRQASQPAQINNEETKQLAQKSKQALEFEQSKKRKLAQITNPAEANVFNPRQKIRKLTQSNSTVVMSNQDMIELQRERLTIKCLPWDCLGIVLNFISKDEYRKIRLNKEFYYLINKRKKGLTFAKAEIRNEVFFRMIKHSLKIERFAIQVRQLKSVTQTEINDHFITFPNLVELDLLKLQFINEASLSRLINACTKKLTKLKLSYACNGLGMQSMASIAKCKNLKFLQLGEYDEYHKSIQPERLNQVKKLMRHKTFSLEYLTLYQADKTIIDILALQQESETLMQLCIVQFIQTNKVKVDELSNLSKLKSLQSFNLCSSYYPLEFQIELPDEQNDQQISVAGNRELELILFTMKNKLRVLSLGDYCYDELLNFIAEMCKNIEKLEINSTQVTDKGLVQILRKLENLKYLDLSACPNFTGLAFYEVDVQTLGLKKAVVALQGYDMQKFKERLTQISPQCAIELKLKKSFKLS